MNLFNSFAKTSPLWNITLPSNIHLLSLIPESSTSLIVRLEHFYEANEDPVLSLPVTLDLFSVFSQAFDITNVQELALGANINVEALNERLRWQIEPGKNHKVKKINLTSRNTNDSTFTFNPMQIRTFRISYKPN